MKKTRIPLSVLHLLAIAVGAFAAGCYRYREVSVGDFSRASVGDALESKDRGTSRIYEIQQSKAWDIARAAVLWEGCDVIEENHVANYLATSHAGNLVSEKGTVVVVWLEPLVQDGQEATRVTVVTKRRDPLEIATALTETTVHRRFSQGLEIVKSGKPLPSSAP